YIGQNLLGVRDEKGFWCRDLGALPKPRRHCGRMLQSFCTLDGGVVPFVPILLAGPAEPPIVHFASRSALRICSRSASSSVFNDPFEDGDSTFSSDSGALRSEPDVKITARSMKFSNSRTLPGHG